MVGKEGVGNGDVGEDTGACCPAAHRPRGRSARRGGILGWPDVAVAAACGLIACGPAGVI